MLSSCVVGLPHADLGAASHAVVQTREPVTAEDLLVYLRDRLPRYELPRSVEFTDVPLRDDAGKVRRAALRAERLSSL